MIGGGGQEWRGAGVAEGGGVAEGTDPDGR